MYIPNHFREASVARLHEVIRAYPFAPIVSTIDGAPFATHLPFLLNASRGEFGMLRGHMARPNPHWRGFTDGVEALVIFQGPHAFISPTWYESQPAVPTWNYVSVHAYGIPRCVDDAELREILAETVSTFEEPGSGLALPEEYVEKLIRGIVGFELEITRLEGKFKLSQNRSPEDQRGAIEALAASARADDRETAAFMNDNIHRTTEHN